MHRSDDIQSKAIFRENHRGVRCSCRELEALVAGRTADIDGTLVLVYWNRKLKATRPCRRLCVRNPDEDICAIRRIGVAVEGSVGCLDCYSIAVVGQGGKQGDNQAIQKHCNCRRLGRKVKT